MADPLAEHMSNKSNHSQAHVDDSVGGEVATGSVDDGDMEDGENVDNFITEESGVGDDVGDDVDAELGEVVDDDDDEEDDEEEEEPVFLEDLFAEPVAEE